MWFLFLIGLWTAMLLSPVIALWAFLPVGRRCPRCSHDTLAIRSAPLRPVSRWLGRRWCMACGWDGVARIPTMNQIAPRYAGMPRAQARGDDVDAWRGNTPA